MRDRDSGAYVGMAPNDEVERRAAPRDQAMALNRHVNPPTMTGDVPRVRSNPW